MTRSPASGPTRKARGTTVSLLAFAALYIVALAWAPTWWWATGAAVLGAGIALGAWCLARRARHPARQPGARALRAVALTSFAEAIGLAGAVATFLVADLRWLALPLLLTTVTVHVASLAVAFRRAADAWALGWIVVATAIAWSCGPDGTAWAWPVSGALAAGMCVGYVLALHSARRSGRVRADSSPDVSVRESASPAT